MPVPTVLSKCGGAKSSRSHLKCQDTSHDEPSSLKTNATSHQRSISTVADCGVARPGLPRVQ